MLLVDEEELFLHADVLVLGKATSQVYQILGQLRKD
jgi:hypothetical protein